MARKKQSDETPALPRTRELESNNASMPSSPEEASAEVSGREGNGVDEFNSASTAAASPPSILDEVQRFLEQRETLLRKLADEIEAAEARLVELRRTYQLIQAEASVDHSKDKKSKKPKPKAAPKSDRRTAEARSEEADDAAEPTPEPSAIDPDAFETPAE